MSIVSRIKDKKKERTSYMKKNIPLSLLKERKIFKNFKRHIFNILIIGKK